MIREEEEGYEASVQVQAQAQDQHGGADVGGVWPTEGRPPYTRTRARPVVHPVRVRSVWSFVSCTSELVNKVES